MLLWLWPQVLWNMERTWTWMSVINIGSFQWHAPFPLWVAKMGPILHLSLYPHPLPQNVAVLSHSDAGLSHVTWFGQSDMSKCDASWGLKNTCVIGFVPSHAFAIMPTPILPRKEAVISPCLQATGVQPDHPCLVNGMPPPGSLNLQGQSQRQGQLEQSQDSDSASAVALSSPASSQSVDLAPLTVHPPVSLCWFSCFSFNPRIPSISF